MSENGQVYFKTETLLSCLIASNSYSSKELLDFDLIS